MTITKDEAKALLNGATEGPWRTWSNGTKTLGVCSAANDRAICEIPSPSIQDWEANARLIAAAPDIARAFIASEEARENLEDRVRVLESSRADAMLLRHMNAPEDPHVEALCERYGYGAVMDAASRLWARKDSMGAFYIGGCIGMKSDDEARAALNGRTGK